MTTRRPASPSSVGRWKHRHGRFSSMPERRARLSSASSWIRTSPIAASTRRAAPMSTWCRPALSTRRRSCAWRCKVLPLSPDCSSLPKRWWPISRRRARRPSPVAAWAIWISRSCRCTNAEERAPPLRATGDAVPDRASPRGQLRSAFMKKHLLEAAERGNAEAQFNLGVMCENGLDDNHYVAEGSRLEAERWFLAAAEQGLPRAQIKLAEIYAEEPDIPGSSIKACGWFLLATATLRGAHLERAQSAYQRASSRLTPNGIADARHFAEGWKPDTPTIATASDE